LTDFIAFDWKRRDEREQKERRELRPVGRLGVRTRVKRTRQERTDRFESLLERFVLGDPMKGIEDPVDSIVDLMLQLYQREDNKIR
jgi:hypothetical protein